jgi:hypothetical protein
MAGCVIALAAAPVAAHSPGGAIFTTVSDGSEVNYNIYAFKTDVYLDGGPGIGAPATAAGLDDGTYVFQITDPSGKNLLSTDAARCRQFTVVGGLITGVVAQGDGCQHVTAFDIDHDAVTVQMYPFDDTPNNGGEYKAWAVTVGDFLAGCSALGQANGLNVVNCGSAAGNRHGFIPAHTKTDNFKVRDMDLPMGVDWTRMDHRRSLLSVVDERFRSLDTTGIGDSMEAYYQTAFGLMRSPKAKKAFQISEEPEPLREKYGRTSLGQGCLLARRLVESGVRFVTVSRGFNTWDHHRDIFPTLANDFLPELDRAFASLVEDLDQRGMLDTTLVIVTGEFGRTPEINAMGGRDHWPNAFSLALAGAGITGGRVLGESDEQAMFVKDHPVEVPDLVATIYRKLGIDYNKEYVSNIGRPVKIANSLDDRTGSPVKELLA